MKDERPCTDDEQPRAEQRGERASETERDKLDGKVMAAIRAGHVYGQAIAIILGFWDDRTAVDASTERLRKAGRIQYDAATGWSEVMA